MTNKNDIDIVKGIIDEHRRHVSTIMAREAGLKNQINQLTAGQNEARAWALRLKDDLATSEKVISVLIDALLYYAEEERWHDHNVFDTAKENEYGWMVAHNAFLEAMKIRNKQEK